MVKEKTAKDKRTRGQFIHDEVAALLKRENIEMPAGYVSRAEKNILRGEPNQMSKEEYDIWFAANLRDEMGTEASKKAYFNRLAQLQLEANTKKPGFDPYADLKEVIQQETHRNTRSGGINRINTDQEYHGGSIMKSHKSISGMKMD